jgi:hypothetical protein
LEVDQEEALQDIYPSKKFHQMLSREFLVSWFTFLEKRILVFSRLTTCLDILQNLLRTAIMLLICFSVALPKRRRSSANMRLETSGPTHPAAHIGIQSPSWTNSSIRCVSLSIHRIKWFSYCLCFE